MYHTLVLVSNCVLVIRINHSINWWKFLFKNYDFFQTWYRYSVFNADLINMLIPVYSIFREIAFHDCWSWNICRSFRSSLLIASVKVIDGLELRLLCWRPAHIGWVLCLTAAIEQPILFKWKNIVKRDVYFIK